MANPSPRKLNQLQQLPDSALVDAAWLERHGYSSSLRSQYVKAGWLHQPATRVYRRGNGPLQWQHAVISLQVFMNSELTVGGRTALEELGYAHYLGRRREVHVYGPHKAPAWLHDLPLDVTFHWHNSLRLFPADPEQSPVAAPEFETPSFLPGGFLATAGSLQWGMRLASAERALFQMLDELPGHESFHQVDKLVEGLANLSPRRLQIQLEACRSVKVKRLFFFFADRHRHAWLDGIERQAVDLGTGKRMLVKGGKLDPTYLITVPGDLDEFLDDYRRQVALLIRTLPFVAAEPDFALKGGTAINLFVRNMPRLSVDIDLTYLPIMDRAASLAAIDAGMARMGERITKGIPGAHVAPSRLRAENIITKLVVRVADTQIKIEVTPVLRGVAYDPVLTEVAPMVEEEFGYARISVVSFPDLYAGKIMAALDRQHPRDLFDVRDLLANEGINEELRRAFIVYLISHDRPMAEVLAPSRKPLEAEFARGFEGMTRHPVALEELVAAREALVTAIVGEMPEAHRHFLLGFKRGEPDWTLLGLPAAADLPAVRWKQQNLAKLPQERRGKLIAALEAVFSVE